MANGAARVYNKATGALLFNQPLDTFWTMNSGPAIFGNTFDPRVYFDAATGRWFVNVNDGLGQQANSGILVGVSATNDPTGTWNRFRFDADSSNTRWADFPTMGVSQNWVTISSNMFGISGASTDISFLTIPKANLVAGNATGAQYLQPAGVNSYGFT